MEILGNRNFSQDDLTGIPGTDTDELPDKLTGHLGPREFESGMSGRYRRSNGAGDPRVTQRGADWKRDGIGKRKVWSEDGSMRGISGIPRRRVASASRGNSRDADTKKVARNAGSSRRVNRSAPLLRIGAQRAARCKYRRRPEICLSGRT